MEVLSHNLIIMFYNLDMLFKKMQIFEQNFISNKA